MLARAVDGIFGIRLGLGRDRVAMLASLSLGYGSRSRSAAGRIVCAQMGRMRWLLDGMTVVLKLGALDDVHLLFDRARVRKVIGIGAVASLEQTLVRMWLLVRWETVLGGCGGVAHDVSKYFNE